MALLDLRVKVADDRFDICSMHPELSLEGRMRRSLWGYRKGCNWHPPSLELSQNELYNLI